ncbi:hypothetical protein AAFF_G00067690 [Aldrovandia affinis]|uniref:glutaminase n=1 Tax=Aldrovandia affinis TaxID=143900 RepID=A0AAD7WDF9_9TELE|nr:hypothetical protein AAFF_G00067690 [Aldrovandia affinis]
MEKSPSQDHREENPYLYFQRTPSLRRKWRKRYGGLDGNNLLEPNQEEDIQENGVSTETEKEKDSPQVKLAESQETASAVNAPSPTPKNTFQSQKPVNFVTPGSTGSPSLAGSGTQRSLGPIGEQVRNANPFWHSVSRLEPQQGHGKRKLAADVLFESFASEGRVNMTHFFEAVWSSGIQKSDPRIKDCYLLMKKLQEADGTVDRNTFHRCVTGVVSFILKSLQGRFVIPDFSTFTEETQKLFLKGKQLAPVKQEAPVNADSGKWGVSVCTVDGQRLSVGDYAEPCVLREISWPLIYGIAVDQLGADYVHRYVGVEEFSNLQTLRKDSVGLHALSFYLQEKKCFPESVDINITLDLLLQCSSTEVTCESGAAMAATLANGGLCPLSGDQVLCPSSTRNMLSMMQVAGMKDYSRIFHFKTSVPAVSSQSGGLLMVVPGVLGLMCWAPELDAFGNSWKSVHFCEELVSTFQLHSFDVRTPFRQVVAYRQWKSESEGYQIMNILLAAYRGDVQSLRRYFLSGADVNALDYDGRSALHVAASEGHVEVVRFLIENAGAQPSANDRWGNTALQEAVRSNHAQTVQLLNNYPTHPDTPN